jgi:hypothetical protein
MAMIKSTRLSAAAAAAAVFLAAVFACFNCGTPFVPLARHS